jgi:hypothetical protein
MKWEEEGGGRGGGRRLRLPLFINMQFPQIFPELRRHAKKVCGGDLNARWNSTSSNISF